jgi:ABC-type antimicrobial peptide transport system permease subunit
VAQALGRPPYSALDVSSRRTVERSLQDDPLARGLVLALAAGAALALLLALAGLLLAVTSDLRDEQGTLADLEAQGLAPGQLRLHVRLRAAMLVAAGLVGGIGVGVALVAAVHNALLTAATIGDPVPPLQTAVPWLSIGVGVVAIATVASLAVEGPVRLALRGASPRRGAGGGW